MNVKIKDVFVISDKDHEEHEKKPWTKIGVAFVNRDESLNVVLDAIPLTGKLHIRERKPYTQNQKAGEL